MAITILLPREEVAVNSATAWVDASALTNIIVGITGGSAIVQYVMDATGNVPTAGAQTYVRTMGAGEDHILLAKAAAVRVLSTDRDTNSWAEISG